MSTVNPSIKVEDEKCLLLGNHGLIIQAFLGGFTIAVAIGNPD